MINVFASCRHSTSASYSLPPRMISPARCYSAYGSVSTISNAFSMSMCLHSIHRQLEKLRVLKLDNNRLQTFQIFCSSEEKSLKTLDDRSDSLGSLSTSRSNSPMAKVCYYRSLFSIHSMVDLVSLMHAYEMLEM